MENEIRMKRSLSNRKMIESMKTKLSYNPYTCNPSARCRPNCDRKHSSLGPCNSYDHSCAWIACCRCRNRTFFRRCAEGSVWSSGVLPLSLFLRKADRMLRFCPCLRGTFAPRYWHEIHQPFRVTLEQSELRRKKKVVIPMSFSPTRIFKENSIAMRVK